MQSWINKLWYQGHPLRFLLWPLSVLFGVITCLRRTLFALGIAKQTKLPVPVIIVGNITVGGSGKTPTVIYLIELLRKHGYNPGVISRGYGVDIDGVRAVLPGDTAAKVGDEPAMLVARTAVPMVVGAKRVDAANALLENFNVDVIISDDGLQHYALGRDIELIILDGERRLGSGMLLPAGPLREGKWRMANVDHVIVNGGVALAAELQMQLQPTQWLPVSGYAAEHTAPKADQAVVAMAGIGNPARFFDSLTEQGFKLESRHAFDDHSAYKEAELMALTGDKPLVMTEKDAVKCREFAKDNWWYLAVDAKLPPSFDQQLLARIKQLAVEKQR
ncbi:tetraacyldisaccharide 4'-kinase [Shewanella sp. KX20019]|uniref:tetraacyldisaccharide 4'-kinase n=1 Tax=Shewanella sp. KX20019 TaxID=2803864 RepID=UPI001929001A|nr:tetraacyldisaccharide 4'-kinase [Shewanella sp. KX20019]QQX82050.1 tetraacyldisaccharide 4'-kinase [Shewanella sp. KX20019]